MEKPDSLHTLGLEVTAHTIRGVQLTQRKGRPVVDRLFELKEPIEDSEFRAAVDKNLVVATLPNGVTLVRQLEVKLRKVADIDAVLSFQAEPLLPYPIENGCLDRILLGETAEGRQLTLVSVRKDHLQQHLDLCHSFEIEPEVVTATPAAIAAFVHYLSPTDQLQGVIHLGENETTCVLMREGKLIAAQGFSFTLDSAEQEEWRMEIMRTFFALSKMAKGVEISQIIATGVGAEHSLVSTLLQPIGKPFTILEAPEGFGLNGTDLQKFAVPLGAALMALPGGEQINFRQEEFSFPNPWKRYKQPVLLFMALCLGLAAALFFAGNAYIRYQDDELRKDYSELLQSLNKPYTEFEKAFSKKKGGEETILSIRQLSPEDILNRLHFLQKELQSAPEHYPLLPNAPTVSDLLAWLTTHPKVAERDAETNEVTPLIQLENLSYTMIKRPEQTKKQEKYQVKVEMEFSSITPKAAREFHDALIAPNVMVDPKGEVKWSTNRGYYRASFFLKDKTIYPMGAS